MLEQAAGLDPTTASPTRSFVLGLSLILQADGSTLRPFLFDGHGTGRGLVDATGRLASGQILAYDAFGVRTDAHSAVLTPIQYTGQWFDEVLGQGYHRHRWLTHGTGSWNAYDRYEGSWLEPISLAKYFYANASPIHFTDSSGMFSFAELMVTVGIQAFIGAALGVGINAVNNYAHGRALTYGAYQAALAGALLAPAALAFPLLGLVRLRHLQRIAHRQHGICKSGFDGWAEGRGGRAARAVYLRGSRGRQERQAGRLLAGDAGRRNGGRTGPGPRPANGTAATDAA